MGMGGTPNNHASDNTAEIIAQVRVADYERFLAIQLAPKAKRAALYALTAFHCEMAAICDKVSEAMIGHIRLAWWREAVAEMLAGASPRHHPVTLALAPLLADARGLADDLNAIIDARASELEDVAFADEAAWQAYVEGTVGALHRAWAWVLDEKAAADKAATIRAQADSCALIAALRDIPRMAVRGAVRLPPEPVVAHGLSSLAPSDALNAMVLSVLATHLAKHSHARLGGAMRPLDGILILQRYAGRGLQRSGGNPYLLRLGKLGQVWAILKLTDL
jgi:phytoene synthase